MTQKIKVALVGYGNLGRGAEAALAACPDMELVGVFSRRPVESLEFLYPATKGLPYADIEKYKDEIDVLLLCGGSKSDLPEQSPYLAQHFNIVDSFDTHAKVNEHFAALEAAAKPAGKLALMSAGWDPGLFSINRLLGEAILPLGETYTFWGKGLSQGHSDAVRRVEGVKLGVQYTLPNEAAIEQVRAGKMPQLATKDKHLRECYLVLAEGAVAEAVEKAITTMPDYFADYTTKVHFISETDFYANHQQMPHGGFVMRSGFTGKNATANSGNNQNIEFSLKLGSNPEFTASVLVACARAVHKLALTGATGALSMLDLPLGLLSPKAPDVLRKELL